VRARRTTRRQPLRIGPGREAPNDRQPSLVLLVRLTFVHLQVSNFVGDSEALSGWSIPRVHTDDGPAPVAVVQGPDHPQVSCQRHGRICKVAKVHSLKGGAAAVAKLPLNQDLGRGMKQSAHAASDAKQLQRDHYYMKLAVAVRGRENLPGTDEDQPEGTQGYGANCYGSKIGAVSA
jgi:hypothetical protein